MVLLHDEEEPNGTMKCRGPTLIGTHLTCEFVVAPYCGCIMLHLAFRLANVVRQ